MGCDESGVRTSVAESRGQTSVAAKQKLKATAIPVAIQGADLRGIRFVIAESSYQHGNTRGISQDAVPIRCYYGQ
jgi:hypothetical protein